MRRRSLAKRLKSRVVPTFSATDKYQSIQGGIWLSVRRNIIPTWQILTAKSQRRSADDAGRIRCREIPQRLKLASEAENVYQPLLDKGYVSKLQVMQSTDTKRK